MGLLNQTGNPTMKSPKYFYTNIDHSNCTQDENAALLKLLENSIRLISQARVNKAEILTNDLPHDQSEMSALNFTLIITRSNQAISGIEYWRCKFTNGAKTLIITANLTNLQLDA
jgi:hypothetical protein